jgi:hypothetical protein
MPLAPFEGFGSSNSPRSERASGTKSRADRGGTKIIGCVTSGFPQDADERRFNIEDRAVGGFGESGLGLFDQYLRLDSGRAKCSKPRL